MEIRQLKYFLAVCQYGSISKAAESLFISQQTLSRQIKEFEEELGVPLFVRGKRGVELTKYGQSLLGSAMRIVQQADDTFAMMKAMRPAEYLPVRIGYRRNDSNFRYALPPRMMFEWEKRFPNMQLIIKEFSHNDLEPMLLRGELDLIYTIGNDNPALRLFPIALEPVYLLVSEKNPLADCGELSVEDLKNERFLISSLEPMSQEDKNCLAEQLGFRPDYQTFNGTFEQSIQYVRSNKGVLLCGRSFWICHRTPGITELTFPVKDVFFRHYLACKANEMIPEPVNWIIKESQRLYGNVDM